MPRHNSPMPRRLAPFRRATATAGLTAAALVVGAGGYSVATSPALAATPGDRFALTDVLGGDKVAALDPDAVTDLRDGDQASRSQREPLTPGLPSTSAQAQSWVDEVGILESGIAARTAAQEAELAAAEAAAAEAERVAAAEEAERVAAAEEAERVAAAEEAERVAAAEEAERVAAEEAAAEEAAAEEAAAEEAAAEEAAAQVASADPGSSRAIAQSLLGTHGWGGEQWSCLDQLWEKESNWTHTADNPSSSAYGIPQALPGSKMSSAGSDWETNPETQIRWGLGYIDGRYGSPCAAWEHSVNNNWY